MGALQSAAGFALFSYVMDYMGVSGGGDAAHAVELSQATQVCLVWRRPVADRRHGRISEEHL